MARLDWEVQLTIPAGGNVRRKRTANFTIIGNQPMDDARLSAETLGVLCYVRSRPDNWQTHPLQLATRFGCGRDRIYRILNDLIEAGYVERSRQRIEGGKWGQVEYVFYDDALEPRPENPYLVQPDLDQPDPAQPDLENADTLTSTDSSPSTDSKTRTDHTKDILVGKPTKRAKLTDAEIDHIFEDRFWPAYPKRIGDRRKPEAKKKFRSLVKKSGAKADFIMEKIIDAAKRHAANWKPRIERKPADAQYIEGAVVWLNKNRWDDEQGDQPAAGETMFDLANHFEQRVREAADHGHRTPSFSEHSLIDD